jgi:hypothetical protein
MDNPSTPYRQSSGLQYHHGRPSRDASPLQYILIEEHLQRDAALAFGLNIASLLMWTIEELQLSSISLNQEKFARKCY